MSEFKPGTRIWYEGDMANCGGYGTITQCREPTKWAGPSIDIQLDDPRFEGDEDRLIKGLPTILFGETPSQRFMFADDYDAAREMKIKAMIARMPKREPEEERT